MDRGSWSVLRPILVSNHLGKVYDVTDFLDVSSSAVGHWLS